MQITHNGQQVCFADGGNFGSAEGSALVMLHGAGMNRTVWQMQTRYLSHHGFRVAALDLPGHGGTDGPALESIEEMADWVVGVLGTLGFDSAHFVGHSMGTYVALEVARRHPRVARSLVLLGTAAKMRVNEALISAAMLNTSEAAALITSWGIGSRAHLGGHANPGSWLLGGSRALIESSSSGVLAIDLAACQAYGDAVEAAASTTCPATLILGAQDKMTPPKNADPLIAAFKNPTVKVLDEIGHMMPLESPHQIRKLLISTLHPV